MGLLKTDSELQEEKRLTKSQMLLWLESVKETPGCDINILMPVLEELVQRLANEEPHA